MQRIWGTVTDGQGNGSPNATVKIYDAGTQNLSVVYEPSEGVTPVTAISNPITADGLGRYICAIVDGVYRIEETPVSGPVKILDWISVAQRGATGPTGAAGPAGTNGTGTVNHTLGPLAASALMVGNGGDDSKALASLGTATTLLHGNAAGLPTFGSVVLTADISGILPVANGGTNLASGTSGGILGYTATGTLTSSVLLTANAIVLGAGAGATPTPMGSLGTTTTVLHGNAAGAPAFAAVSLTTDVSGILPVANGGTGVAYFTVAGPTALRTYTFYDANGTIPSLDSTGTFTNKRITGRTSTTASSATPTPNADTDDVYEITALAAAAAFGAPTGTPTNHQKLIIWIKDNATARALSWNAVYVAGGYPLPTTTILSKIMMLGFEYTTANSLNKWRLVAFAQEA